MDVKVGNRWESMVEGLVQSGRYTSADDVVSEGLRLVQDREEKFEWLRRTIASAIEEGGSYTDEDVEKAIEARLSKLSLDDEAA